jgi:hypothetical protein
MNLSVIRSKKVCGGHPYFLGVAFGGEQVRIGLLLFHVVILFK